MGSQGSLFALPVVHEEGDVRLPRMLLRMLAMNCQNSIFKSEDRGDLHILLSWHCHGYLLYTLFLSQTGIVAYVQLNRLFSGVGANIVVKVQVTRRGCNKTGGWS